VTVAARMLFAFGRDGLGTTRLADVSPRSGTPAKALAVELLVALVLLTAFRVAGTAPLDVFFYLATLGVLSLLVMYALTNVAALRYLVAPRAGRTAAALIPAAGVVIAGYVLYRNVWPVPPAPYEYFPYAVAGWLLLGGALSLVLRRRPAPSEQVEGARPADRVEA